MYVTHVSSHYYMRPHTSKQVSSCIRILEHEGVSLHVRYAPYKHARMHTHVYVQQRMGLHADIPACVYRKVSRVLHGKALQEESLNRALSAEP